MKRFLAIAFFLVVGLTIHAQNNNTMTVLNDSDAVTVLDQKIDEVAVKATLPLVEMTAGKTTFRIDASIIQQTGSLYDALKALPGVYVDANGNITLKGKSGVLVLMDGKPTYMSGEDLISLLKSMPASTADKIDVIDHPSARYEAAGSAGIIDIRSKKIKMQGMNLALRGSGCLGPTGNGHITANLNVRQNDLNFFFNGSYYKGKDRIDLNVKREFENSTTVMNQVSLRKRWNDVYYTRFGFDYSITPQTVWGVAFSGFQRNQDEDAAVESVANDETAAGATISNADNLNRNLSASTFLQHRLEEDKGEVYGSFDYFHYKNGSKQWIEDFKPDTLKSDIDGVTNIYVGQVDFERKWLPDFKTTMGLKSSYVDIDNMAQYMRPTVSGWKTDGALCSHYQFDENINAVFVEALADFGIVKALAGLRVEHTRTHGDFSENSVQKDSSFVRNDVDFFPSGSVDIDLAEKHKLQLTYSRRITRPHYGDLNPFTYIFDEYTYEGGNTKLHSYFTNSVELSYLYSDFIQASYLYQYEADVIWKSFSREDKRIYVRPNNLSSRLLTGVIVNVMNLKILPVWKMQITGILAYNKYEWTEIEKKYTKECLSPMIATYSQFEFTPTWSADLSTSYTGRYVGGQATIEPRVEIGFGINKKLFNNRCDISLWGRDILNMDNPKMKVQALDMIINSSDNQNLRQFGIAIAWRFKKGLDASEKGRNRDLEETKRVNM